MNLTTLITNTNYRRGDTSESFVDETELLAYYNEALRRLQTEYDYEWATNYASFSFVDGSHVYKLSAIATDFKSSRNMFYNDDYTFNFVSPEDFYQLSASSYNMFSVDNNELLVQTSFGSGTLSLKYYSNYTAQTSGGSWLAQLSATTDSPLLPSEYHDILVDYAAARCFQKEGRLDDFKLAYGEYQNGIKNLKQEFPSKKNRALTRMRHINEFRIRNYTGKSNPLSQ
jgi:hypothetical protein